MTVVTRWAWAVVILLCLGCGESKQHLEAKGDLQSVVLAYHNFYSDRGRGPHNAEELMEYKDPAAASLPVNAAAQSRARKALQSGDYVVIWDVEILPRAERNAGMVLAYHRDVPEKGGTVCYQDGEAATLTREEFVRAPKSQPVAEPKK